MDTTKKQIGLLAICQGLLLTNNSVLITINGLTGLALAPDKGLATLPVTTYLIGSALTTLPVSLLMRQWGRRAGFTLGAICAILGSVLCAFGVYTRDFWVVCGGTLVLGIYFAAGQYYRFAAAEVAPANFKSKAISLVLAGGILGGFLGPFSSRMAKDAVPGHTYAGGYLSLVLFALLAILVLRWLRIPPLPEGDRRDTGRPLRAIAMQPAFVVAVLCAVVSYGVMNLLMTATPLAMIACQHPFAEATFVIQWHVLGMYAPSFFTGGLIQRFGVTRIILTGVILNFVSVAIALAGVDVMNFWFASTLVGIGWNFMYIGATTLLTETHTAAERAKAQGVNDTAIFLTMVCTSFLSGALFTYQGWQTMNMLSLPFLFIAGMGVAGLAWSRRRASAPA